jgi:hypothetical protein
MSIHCCLAALCLPLRCAGSRTHTCQPMLLFLLLRTPASRSTSNVCTLGERRAENSDLHDGLRGWAVRRFRVTQYFMLLRRYLRLV